MEITNSDWRAVPGFDGYEVNRCGQVRSWRRHGKTRRIEPLVLRPDCSKGYRSYRLYDGGQSVKIGGHRAAALAFLPNPDGLPHVAHRNGNPSDNRLENLRWSSVTDNHLDKRDHGTATMGVRNPKAKVNDQIVREIRAYWDAGHDSSQTAARFNISKAQAWAIGNRRFWRHVV